MPPETLNNSIPNSNSSPTLKRHDSGFLTSSSHSSIEDLVYKKKSAEISQFLTKQLKKKHKYTDSEELKRFFKVLFSIDNGKKLLDNKTGYGIYDQRLRRFLKLVPLTGETHFRSEFLNLFSSFFVQFSLFTLDTENLTQVCTNDMRLMTNNDVVFQLTFAIVLLNTDLHISSAISKCHVPQTKIQFIENTNQAVATLGQMFTDDNKYKPLQFSIKFLQEAYKSTKEKPLPKASTHIVTRSTETKKPKKNQIKLTILKRYQR